MNSESCYKSGKQHCQCEFKSGICCWCDAELPLICPPLPALPKDLKTASVDDLKQELLYREKLAFENKNRPPVPDNDPDLTNVVRAVNSIVEHLRTSGCVNEDYAFHMFELVVNSMYRGSLTEFWNWWNWRRRGGR